MASIIGSGLFMFAVHNPLQPLKGYFFLPVVGLSISLLAGLMVLYDNRKNITWGSKWLYIPLLVIAFSIAMSGILNGEGIGEKISIVLLSFYFIGVYLVARILRDKLFIPFAWGMVISAVGCIIWGALNPGEKTGGYVISPGNYDIIVGVLALGLLISAWKHQWWLSGLAIAGVFFTGSDEGIFVVAVVVIFILVRRDWSKKLLVPVSTLVILLAICTPLGVTQKLYYPTAVKVALAKEVIEDTPVATAIDAVIPDMIQKPVTNKLEQVSEIAKREGMISEDGGKNRGYLLNMATGYRWIDHWKLSVIKPFGHGYNMTQFYDGIPHNIVLIIIEQVGIIAMLAWLFVTIYCLMKTRWRYVFIAILALGVFDHFIWTQIGVWWWAIVGGASISIVKSDLIFKKYRPSYLTEVKDRYARIVQISNGGVV